MTARPPTHPAVSRLIRALLAVPVWLQAPALLAARLYVGQIFFRSAVESLRDWAGTVWLYQNQFHVPVLGPLTAAVLGTAGELLLPPLLVLGAWGRLGAFGLLVVNFVALDAYRYALAPLAIGFHVLWGVLLGMVWLWGPGRWSFDAWWARRVTRPASC